MLSPSLYLEALGRAAEMVGGRQRLAETLGVRREEIDRWMNGEKVPPPGILFAALSIVESARREGRAP